MLNADDGLMDAEIAEEVEVAQRTVERVRERCCVHGLQPAVEQRRPPRPPRAPVLHGAAEARLDVLDVYHRAYDPLRPQVCVDETSKQLLDHARAPIPASPGVPARVDDEYCRCGTANIFMAIEPLTGRVMTQATERRTSVDFAKFLRWLSDDEYPLQDERGAHQTAASLPGNRRCRGGWRASRAYPRPLCVDGVVDVVGFVDVVGDRQSRW